jgi:hypothetical protein
MNSLKVIALATAGLLVLAGCHGKKTKEKAAAFTETPSRSGLIVTPENFLSGKVVSVNAGARFVVLNFPPGHVPAADRHLNLYRRGLKVGEVKVTDQQLDDNTIADILSGVAEPGDEARE